MCVFQTFGWPMDGLIGHDQISYFFGETQPSTNITTTTNSTTAFLPSQDQQDLLLELDHQSTSFPAHNTNCGDPNVVKKLNHNASERHRRKKMNTLYSSLRSLLPLADQLKKLSIPATISRVLKYVPELEQQLERLVQRKEDLLLKLSKQDEIINPQITQRKGTAHGILSVVSANQLNEKEVAVQISTCNSAIHTCPLSEILLHLEEEGLFLINSSSFESFEGRIFYNLHLQVDGNYRLECDALSEKLTTLYDNRDGLFT